MRALSAPVMHYVSSFVEAKGSITSNCQQRTNHENEQPQTRRPPQHDNSTASLVRAVSLELGRLHSFSAKARCSFDSTTTFLHRLCYTRERNERARSESWSVASYALHYTKPISCANKRLCVLIRFSEMNLYIILSV